MEYAELEHSKISLLVHDKSNCLNPEVCTIHNRTNHNMRGFKQFYSFDRHIMERICTHGIGHPDPDDIRIINGSDNGEHGCDGCCLDFKVQEDYEDS